MSIPDPAHFVRDFILTLLVVVFLLIPMPLAIRAAIIAIVVAGVWEAANSAARSEYRGEAWHPLHWSRDEWLDLASTVGAVILAVVVVLAAFEYLARHFLPLALAPWAP